MKILNMVIMATIIMLVLVQQSLADVVCSYAPSQSNAVAAVSGAAGGASATAGATHQHIASSIHYPSTHPKSLTLTALSRRMKNVTFLPADPGKVIRDRWYRCARPPAHGCEPSGF